MLQLPYSILLDYVDFRPYSANFVTMINFLAIIDLVQLSQVIILCHHTPLINPLFFICDTKDFIPAYLFQNPNLSLFEQAYLIVLMMF